MRERPVRITDWNPNSPNNLAGGRDKSGCRLDSPTRCRHFDIALEDCDDATVGDGLHHSVDRGDRGLEDRLEGRFAQYGAAQLAEGFLSI